MLPKSSDSKLLFDERSLEAPDASRNFTFAEKKIAVTSATTRVLLLSSKSKKALHTMYVRPILKMHHSHAFTKNYSEPPSTTLPLLLRSDWHFNQQHFAIAPNAIEPTNAPAPKPARRAGSVIPPKK